MAEKEAEKVEDAGFPPSVQNSDNEGNEEDEDANGQGDAEAEADKEEENKEAAVDPAEEEKKEPNKTAKAENPEEKIFDRVIKVKPKEKLKGIRRTILEELGCQDSCTARLYLAKSNKKKSDSQDEDQEKAEGDEGQAGATEEQEK